MFQDDLTHYVIVRRDLPYGLTLAMVGHAAGESFYLFGGSSADRASGSITVNPEVDGSSPSRQSIPRCTIVVLGARNELKLHRLRRRLERHNVPHVPFYESDPPYDRQLMSIGLVPGPKESLYCFVNDFALWPYYGPADMDEPQETASSSAD